MKFFDRMFTVFLLRQKPDSTIANPRFMKKTSMAVTKVQMVSAITLASEACAVGAGVSGGAIVVAEDSGVAGAPSGSSAQTGIETVKRTATSNPKTTKGLILLIFSSKLDLQMKTGPQYKNKKAPADHATGAFA
ncbi:MAG TPA: hypothetical protein VFG95_08035 [Nitrospiria bacterium]|nr:hypothetical protein [Nitrospiria bacterium]